MPRRRRPPAPRTAPQSLFDQGGVFALTGPTGVGKTTTVAKIAAQYAMQHGASQVALITADVYRIGAQEQLRSFGQMLGVPVHVAHDRAALKELLGLFGDRKLVLIDTAGVSQRDTRVGQLLAALDLDPIQRVVVLNAGMQAASLQDVASAYRAQECAGVLLSKTDEAVQLGSAIDCLVRNRLRLLGFANGQRVPEDFHAPDFEYLVECAMASAAGRRPRTTANSRRPRSGSSWRARMFETAADQADGLRRLFSPREPSVIPMACCAPRRGLPRLCRACWPAG